MKPVITNLHLALTYQLEGMYEAEKQIQKLLPELEGQVTSAALQKELNEYLESATDKRIKLKRIFSYLLSGPFWRKNNVVKEQLKELKSWVFLVAPSPLRDKMMIDSMQNIIRIKVATYGNAKILAEELSLQSVADLLEEILLWELEASHQLTKLSGERINKQIQKESVN